MAALSRSAWLNAWEDDLVPSPASSRSAARAAARTRSVRYYGREATARLPQPVPDARRAETAPDLKIVTRRRPRWGALFVALAFVALLLAVAVVLPVLLTSAATGVESQVGQLERTQDGLATSVSALSAQISALAAPERVAEEAVKLGLEPASSVHYLQMETGLAASEGDSTVAGR